MVENSVLWYRGTKGGGKVIIVNLKFYIKFLGYSFQDQQNFQCVTVLDVC